MKHRLLIDWLWWLPVVLYGFDMVPTKVELTGTITNIIDWTTEVTNFNLDYQAVGYSPFTTTNPNRTIVWTLTVLPIICSSDRNQGGDIPKAVLLASTALFAQFQLRMLCLQTFMQTTTLYLG